MVSLSKEGHSDLEHECAELNMQSLPLNFFTFKSDHLKAAVGKKLHQNFSVVDVV